MSVLINCQRIKTKTLRYLLIGIITLIGQTACVRKVTTTPGFQHAFRQGLTDNLYNLKDFQVINFNHLRSLSEKTPTQNISYPRFNLKDIKDKIISIKTASTGTPVKILTGGGNIQVDSQLSFINQYYLIKYRLTKEPKTKQQKLLHDLLGEVQNFKGFPDTVYHIVPHLEGNYLILYRVADKNKIPYDEYSSGIKINDQLMAVPLVGYHINYCQAEVIKNANNENTGQYRPICEKIQIKEAEYIRFTRNSKQIFAYRSKVDIFPTDFFKGKWFFTWTIIESKENTVTEDFQHIGMRSAKLVEFRKEPDHLLAIDASGSDIEDKDKQQALRIPIIWKEYEFINNSNSFGEQEKQTNIDIHRPYFKILFNQLMVRNTQILKDIIITDHYFSYTFDTSYMNPLKQEENFKTIKVAFMKSDSKIPYQEKRWFETDSHQFFPTSHVIRAHYQDASTHTKRDINKLARTARFNPNKKVIEWYFSKKTSQSPWVRALGRLAIQLYNRAHQLAAKGTNKSPIQVVLNETEDQELGDTRYNILNLIETKTEQASTLLGSAPNIANPITGEVISGTVNIYVTSLINTYIYIIRNYIRFHVFPPLWKWLPTTHGASLYIKEQIEQFCPEVADFIRRNQGQLFHPVKTILRDKEIVRFCAQQIARPRILFGILHEMGHSFSLRHVFSTSIDADNFYKTYDEIKNTFGESILYHATASYPEPAKSSSVMDYPPINYPHLTVLGKYDIAAIRFVYYDTVQTTNGQFVEIPSQEINKSSKSLLDLMREKNLNLKTYKVCGGHRKDYDIDNPLCNPEDYGSTPLEIVQNTIKDFKDQLNHFKRYDSIDLVNPFITPLKYLGRIRIIFNKWAEKREQLMHNIGTSVHQYNINNINEYKELIKGEAERNPEFQKYYAARQTILDFYKETFFLPVKRCIYQKPDGSYHGVSIHKIGRMLSNQYSNQNRAIVIHCQSPAVVRWANQNQLSFITEVGFFGQTRPYFIPLRFRMDVPDEHSIFTLVIDSSIFKGMLAEAIYEPDFKWEMLSALQQYMLKGLDITPYITDLTINDTVKAQLPKYFLTYESDNNLYPKGGGLMKNAIDMLFEIIDLTYNYSTLSMKEEITSSHTCSNVNISLLVTILQAFKQNQLINEYPLLYTIYQKYTTDLKTNPQADFIAYVFNHPNVYRYIQDPHSACIPKSADVFIGKLIKKYNEYKQCINHHSPQTPCENEIDKRVHIQFTSKIILRDLLFIHKNPPQPMVRQQQK